ncbi:halocyanin precursor-like protein [Haloferax elongans ATCC BAA-1513]|uniref:Halocyanin-like protein n=1 Tax=Haloferax elongans ATCC BAA-1513 TaxID=1230453 RepID=M0HMD9_HALEO|nr:halocyanin domain-containing protein [Haloferax elongans]ELZ84862.1 halocyanin precursor-like protein [Haloferax elongans ATCC BAA-1513]
MTSTGLSRRRFTALVATTSISAALAGCTSSSGDAASEEPETAEEDPAENTETSDSSGSESGQAGDTQNFDGWFDDVENFDGVDDETGSDAVAVDVGVEANGGAFGFGPAAVRVSKGTTVTWTWNGKGGTHNVVHTDGEFESELVGDEGHTFEYTFESAGVYKYSCVPHETLGMKGAVVVE